MEWNRLIQPPARDFHSEETAAIREELAAEVAGITASREKLDARYEEIRSQPIDDIQGGDVFQADLPKAARFELLQWELRVRKRIAEFFTREDVEREAAHSVAYEAHENRSAKVRKQLLRIGYLEQVPGRPTPGALQPGWLLTHPEVRLLKGRADELHRPFAELPQQNDKCTAELLKEMNGLRQQALVG